MDQLANQFADVILPLPLPGYFTYSIPTELQDKVKPGCRVIVQFGVKKFYSALVHKIHSLKPEGYQTKELEYVLDSSPVVLPESFEFWEWVANYYQSSVGEVLKAALPAGLKLESETRVIYNPSYIEEIDKRLSPKEQMLLELICERKNLSISELNNSLLKKSSICILKDLLEKGAVRIEENLEEGYKPKTIPLIELSSRLSTERSIHLALDSLKKIPKQLEMFSKFIDETGVFDSGEKKEIQKKEFLQSNGYSVAVLNTLIKKDFLTIVQKKIDRIPAFKGLQKALSELSPAQQKAFLQIKELLHSKPVTLLHGVTSSGKTEIYIKLIKEYLDQGKQVLYLLPEIGLTTQIILRLEKVFGNKVGIYHSKLNDQERVEIWNKVLNPSKEESSYQLIVGARSSLFLPFNNLGLIIVDEEHDTSYKQSDPSPRYHARDASIVLGNLLKIPILLGTATPSLESYFNAKTGKYGYVALNERYSGIEMPMITTANLKDAYNRKQMRSQLTPLLYDEIHKALRNKEQIILFQNRRGFSPFIQCKSCSWIPKCRNCDVSLTFHKHNNSLICHYCGYSINSPDHCPECGSREISTKGFGTEKVEEDIALLFPEAKIERIDLDTTRTRKAFEKITGAFENGSIDILVGTQMITKGLDFKNVSLVGILNADNLLNHPDFRAYERSFQLLAQVSGRAGRKNKQGKVIIQTSDPENSVIQKVISNNYEEMFQEQLSERKMFKYPPFYRLITIILKHRDYADLDKISTELSNELRTRFGRRVLGPESPVINRIKLLYIKNIWLKIEREVSVVSTKRQMQEIIGEIKSRHKSIVISIDVDPL
jgi:primosomal protein N' (replication factor Y)